MAKRNRFNFQHFKKFLPDVVIGWGAYSDYDVEEKVFFGPFVEASVYFQKKHESGDKKAIFTFVRNYPECFREVWTFPDGTTHTCYSNNNIFTREYGRSWVIEQIEKWRNDDTADSAAKLKKLFSAYSNRRKREKKLPEDDWIIYRQIKERVGRGMKFEDAVIDLIEQGEKGNLAPKTQAVLTKHINDEEAGYYNTFKEIYTKLNRLEKRYIEDKKITEKNLRFNYFLPHKNITIPKNYKDQFNKELSLFCAVEWERIGFISFPRINSELSIYTGCKPLEERKRISLKEALEKVSQEKNIPLSKLRDIYTNLQEIHAMYAGRDVLEVLKEL